MKIKPIKEIHRLLADNRNYYCHITRRENLYSIAKEGLKANGNGEIFVYVDTAIKYGEHGKPFNVGDSIALNQLFIYDKEYLVFFIDKNDITGEVVNDNVEECTAPWQFIIKQDKIEPFYWCFDKNKMLDQEEAA